MYSESTGANIYLGYKKFSLHERMCLVYQRIDPGTAGEGIIFGKIGQVDWASGVCGKDAKIGELNVAL